MYQISVDKFSGPLDALLHLVEDRKLSINEISLAEVADQYISYLKTLAEISKEELAAFLVIASTLILIKSRSLIPHLALSEEEAIDIKELEIRLRMFQFFKILSGHVRELGGNSKHLFGREAYSGGFQIFSPPPRITKETVHALLLEILIQLPKKEELPTDIMEKAISLEEKMEELKSRLQKSFEFSFDEFSAHGGKKRKVEVIISFLALLELIKQGFLVFKQKNLFGSIDLRKWEN